MMEILNAAKTPVFSRYMGSLINRSIISSYKDTMQIFGPAMFHNNTIYVVYTANAADGDVDRVFVASKPYNGSFIGEYTKYSDENGPIPVLETGIEPGAQSSSQLFSRSIHYDPFREEYRMAYTVLPIDFPTTYHYIALATSQDMQNFTKQGVVFQIDQVSFIGWAEIIEDDGTIIGIGTSRAIFEPDYLHYLASTTDGRTWTNDGTLPELASIGLGGISGIMKQDGLYYIFGGRDYSDGNASRSLKIGCVSTPDFVNFTDIGDVITTIRPQERSIGTPIPFVVDGKLNIIHGKNFYQNKAEANGGEAFSEITVSTFNAPVPQVLNPILHFPAFVHRYYPLYHDDEGDTFEEYFLKTQATLTSPTWTDLKFLDCQAGGLTFANTGVIRDTSDFQFKARVEITTDQTQELFSIGTDIIVTIENGLLRVRLNNGTKDYITQNIIAKPTGITDPGTAVYVGFIFRDSTLQLCVGNTVGVPVTQTVDNPMTDVTDSGADVVIGDSATLQMRSVVIMSGATDDNWIYLDL